MAEINRSAIIGSEQVVESAGTDSARLPPSPPIFRISLESAVSELGELNLCEGSASFNEVEQILLEEELHEKRSAVRIKGISVESTIAYRLERHSNTTEQSSNHSTNVLASSAAPRAAQRDSRLEVRPSRSPCCSSAKSRRNAITEQLCARTDARPPTARRRSRRRLPRRPRRRRRRGRRRRLGVPAAHPLGPLRLLHRRGRPAARARVPASRVGPIPRSGAGPRPRPAPGLPTRSSAFLPAAAAASVRAAGRGPGARSRGPSILLPAAAAARGAGGRAERGEGWEILLYYIIMNLL